MTAFIADSSPRATVSQQMDLSDVITGAGVLVALAIGAMQVFIALQQKGIADRQAEISFSQGGIQAVSSWLSFLKDPDPNVRFNAVIALERIGTEEALVPLITALSDPARSYASGRRARLASTGPHPP